MKYMIREIKDHILFDMEYNTEEEAKADIERFKKIDEVEGFDCEYEIIEVEQ